MQRGPCRSHKSSKPINVNPLSLGILHQDPAKSLYLKLYPSSSLDRHKRREDRWGELGGHQIPAVASPGPRLALAWPEVANSSLAMVAGGDDYDGGGGRRTKVVGTRRPHRGRKASGW